MAIYALVSDLSEILLQSIRVTEQEPMRREMRQPTCLSNHGRTHGTEQIQFLGYHFSGHRGQAPDQVKLGKNLTMDHRQRPRSRIRLCVVSLSHLLTGSECPASPVPIEWTSNPCMKCARISLPAESPNYAIPRTHPERSVLRMPVLPVPRAAPGQNFFGARALGRGLSGHPDAFAWNIQREC